MSEISALVLSDIHKLLTSLISNPIYLSYFLFFSPSLLKLISFLSPLFLTTLLLLTFSPYLETPCNNFENDNSDGTIHASQEALQVYSIVFDVGDQQVQQTSSEEAVDVVLVVDHDGDVSMSKSEPVVTTTLHQEEQLSTKVAGLSIKASEGLSYSPLASHGSPKDESFSQLGSYGSPKNESFSQLGTYGSPKDENFSQLGNHGSPKDESFSQLGNHGPPKDENFSKLGRCGSFKDQKFTQLGSYVSLKDENFTKLGNHGSPKDENFSQLGNYGSPKDEKFSQLCSYGSLKDENFTQLGSYGSMRKDKVEWRRTLACKLFEERHHSNSAEGMDLLWEAHDHDDEKKKKKKKISVVTKSKKGSKIGHHCYEDEEEEDEMSWNDDGGGKLCCLQALKLSAGKMNNLAGIGKPSLVKFTKAVKGFGWLHSSRHSKNKRVSL